jgi:hypothetical protein
MRVVGKSEIHIIRLVNGHSKSLRTLITFYFHATFYIKQNQNDTFPLLFSIFEKN